MNAFKACIERKKMARPQEDLTTDSAPASSNKYNASADTAAGPADEWNRQSWLMLITILVMTFMEVIDATIVNIALPTLQADLGADMSSVQWVVSIYAITTCAGLLVFGQLGDIFGKARIFHIGVATFTAGSLLCALSPNLSALVASRALQGLGGAASLANNMGIITEAFPKSRGKALGFVATFTALGAMCGPTVGGLLIAAFPWESIFLINVPIGVASLIIGVRVFRTTMPATPQTESASSHSFDTAGALLMVPAICLLFFSLTRMQTAFGPTEALMLVIVAACLALFVIVEKRASNPLVKLEAFRDPAFDIDLLSMVAVFGAIAGMNVVFPYYLQDARGMSAAASGLVMAAYPLVNAINGPIAGSMSDRWGAEKLTLLAQFIHGAGLIVLSFLSADTPIVIVVLCLMCTSFGSSMFQAPNNALVMGHATPETLGFVGSLGNLMRYLGQSCGLVIGMGVLMAAMSAAAGYSVSAYVDGHPEYFISGFHATLLVLGIIVLASAVLCLLRARILSSRKS
jgi:EmrB/QacA subfamily drug resistance transporter